MSFIHPGGFAFLFQLFVQELRRLRSKLFSENPELPLRLDLEDGGGERWEDKVTLRLVWKGCGRKGTVTLEVTKESLFW